ncbi:MAG: diacylglyceryl transferase [Bacteroidetes bacterium]|nr:diacylglyceryl transferase [Bacteroidota bacterium]
MNYWQRLKTKWNVETDRRMIWIFIIFAITGSCTVYVRKSLYNLLGIQIEPNWLGVVVKFLMIYIIYQILLFTIGSVLGEHKFFLRFLKKMNYRLIGKKISE